MQSNKTAIITGATSGIGLAAAQRLAGQGVRVIGVGRNAQRCEAALQCILNTVPDARVEYLMCDLSSQSQIGDLCRKVEQKYPVIDIFVHAAGVIMSRFKATDDGLETQFAVNHLAAFIISARLMKELDASADARVILLSSVAHRHTHLNFKDLQMRRWYFSLSQYKRTKLCNVLFAAEFNRRFKKTKIRAFTADPGLVKTNIGHSGMSGLEKMVCRIVINRGASPDLPAMNICHLALSPEVLKNDAFYWKNCSPLDPDPYAYNENAARFLWEASEKLSALTLSPDRLNML
ncbi:MAG: SDR family NAD(P)-dependent oxidoreductase [Eubacteriales bacterium]|nr:SDR family NAD(P)-dependent oxidoreductase [Eubacteriales bacterium]